MGNGKLAFDSGEEALKTASISTESSRRATYPMLIQ